MHNLEALQHPTRKGDKKHPQNDTVTFLHQSVRPRTSCKTRCYQYDVDHMSHLRNIFQRESPNGAAGEVQVFLEFGLRRRGTSEHHTHTLWRETTDGVGYRTGPLTNPLQQPAGNSHVGISRILRCFPHHHQASPNPWLLFSLFISRRLSHLASWSDQILRYQSQSFDRHQSCKSNYQT